MPIGADLSARHTEEAVGGGHPTKARVIDRLALTALFQDGKVRANKTPVECACRLDYVNVSTLAFKPVFSSAYHTAAARPVAGRHVPFMDADSGDVYYEELPRTGITITNAGLAWSTAYAVFVHDDAGALRLELDASAAWTFDPATGLPHKTGDARRTLVGIVRTDGLGQFILSTEVGVRSFWNKTPYVARSQGTHASTSSTKWANLATHEILMWPGHDIVRQEAAGHGWLYSTNNPGLVGLDLNLSLLNGTGQAYPQIEILGSARNERDNFGMAKTQVYTGALARVHSSLICRAPSWVTMNVGDYLFQSVVLI